LGREKESWREIEAERDIAVIGEEKRMMSGNLKGQRSEKNGKDRIRGRERSKIDGSEKGAQKTAD